ncbi:MAG: amidohydrolase [Clostridia bacterium]|nr:amidohydrolase [Clostridia bacterium]
MMDIIDAHAHIYERLTGFGPRGEARAIGGGMVEWATGDRERFIRECDGDTGFSPERLLTLMDEGGIAHAVLLQGSNYGFQNSFTAEAVRKYPIRFTGAGSFDPCCAAAPAIFKHLTGDLGFRILKFEISERYGLCGYHPTLQIDGEEFAPYLAKAEEMGLTVTIDTGTIDTKSFQIDGICRVLDRHPRLTLVVAHTLFPSATDGRNDERFALVRKMVRENLYFDITLKNLNAAPVRSYLRAVMDLVGADHMLWGTDCPGAFMKKSYKEILAELFDADCFSKDELAALLGGTARRVYHC